MNKGNNAQSNEYFLIFDIQYTLLEKYIYKTIKNSPEKACSDEEIAEMLCLTPAEVNYIINDECLKQFIQGDYSRRTISSDFTELDFCVIAINDENSETTKSLLSLEKKGLLQNPEFYEEVNHKEISKELELHKAKAYYLVKNDNKP